ncbi:MAG TPA: VWA domain-containing protein [Burkholderiales bacterium]|nr:VWA domain-containing protein [Burkholderiales bacterium]
MRFLALSSAAALALLAGVALVILLLHWLRPPPPKVLVPSGLLWARVVRDGRRPDARRLLLLLLALAAGLSMALALTRPEIPAIASAQRLMLILDNSASMGVQMHDGRSRWQHAIEQASALLRSSAAPSEVMLVDTVGRLRASGFVDRDSALAALGRATVASWGNARLPPGPLPAAAQVHLFTDGVAQVEVPVGAIVHPVFEPVDNVAVTAFAARPLPQEPTRVEAVVQVLNASPGERRVRLLITGGAHFSIAQDLDLRAGETVNAVFDVSDFEGGVLGATAICDADAFALDDSAYALIPPHGPKRVLLVTEGNPALGDALRNLPGVRLTVVAPAGYVRAGEHDAFVFDRFAPLEPPPAGALLLRPPARRWLAGQATQRVGPRIADWNEDHAVTGAIAWGNLRLARASLEAATQTDSHALVLARGSAPGALVTAGETPVRWVKLGFALQDSNFALQPDFPVFLGNALNWVTEPTAVLARELGSVEVALPHAQVHDGSGRPVAASPTSEGIVFEAARADVYTVSGPGGRVLVVANVADPSYALINRTRLGDGQPAALADEAPAPFWRAELWMLLLLCAAAALLLEWAVFTRRRKG